VKAEDGRYMVLCKPCGGTGATKWRLRNCVACQGTGVNCGSCTECMGVGTISEKSI